MGDQTGNPVEDLIQRSEELDNHSTKVCKECGMRKPISEFRKPAPPQTGMKFFTMARCRECRVAYTQKKYNPAFNISANKRKVLDIINKKKGGVT
jgi:hypothetical protein